MKFVTLDFEILMAIQYRLPISTNPLQDLSELIGKKYEEIERKLREYKALGILKRYGANMNYRAFPNFRQSSLVGFKVDEKKASRINELGEMVKHNFLRDSEYNVWFTLKCRNIAEIENIVLKIAQEIGVEDYIILPTKKVYKMDVKYDLYKGISWSYSFEPERVTTIAELGLDESIRRLENLPISRRPFVELGIDEEETVDLIKELMRRGIVRDFSGVLSERGIGFKFNGMNVVKAKNPENLARKLLTDFPQITHLIERFTNEKWDYSLYFMVHAVEKEKVEEIAKKVVGIDGVEDLRVIYSKENLKP
ncbi:MAG: Lrp/AsnC family transcriptional regulator [Archaeoglobaceae archaeon]|nr:Lrp/AsnC family transcriptional regulator [Archaeoglobaceae archaeon]MDW7989312.1 Lrp/AsnC family transcriptional regulator [Archaeoglobaceae archaeon]